MKNFQEVISQARAQGPVRVAVAQAADPEVLTAIIEAKKVGIAEGVLVGDPKGISDLLADLNEDPTTYTIVQATSSDDCAKQAVALVNSGEADVLMKGLLQTATFLRPVLDKEKGLRTGRLISHASVFEWTGKEKLLIVTDCAINITPDLQQKKSILENGIQLAQALGIETPCVAVICALELVNPDMPETLDAAALAKMADRGEIKNAVVDGPLAFDNAVSEEAAAHKGIASPVAGKVDILLMPDMKTGNVIHKSFVHCAHFKGAAVVIGARAPLIATSRSDSADTKLNSLAVANLLAHYLKK
ncbi:bifunctional enoyl-CoA hydratase/phosphate acetyltransferase [Gelria sp. Kuro-4]|uniref:bifunctional enoyl-CoA hydratase/phosphate acetyltransferase n=1 Tax=Gelria sp. Kuro-4 TaxID=2796927 RepID=UPI001BF17E44|nr:bifunctional enoyl-CoA hydratase/phosphate acetyltransferase [Gelria sp. Kuro-4]BCV23485.1 phosphate butyryltransferase [Gelria sp. Kuro-4]